MEIVKVTTSARALPTLPQKILPEIAELTSYLGIPREVLASDEEIEIAWRDLPRELRNLPDEMDKELIARMCVAISTGLFDSAVNYIWNASVLHLRKKVRNFGLLVVAQTLQTDFEEKHLIDLQDSELLDLCHKLNILSDDGFFFLDQCRNIRNNFSAAHPTLGKLNDREFLVFLNRCIKYALADSSSPQGVNISSFISAIKGIRFTDGQRQEWIFRLMATHDAQRQLLIGTAHGIYCDPSSPETARLNALDLCIGVKDTFTAGLRSHLISSHSEYLAKGDEGRYKASLLFFETLGLLEILNESERHSIIIKAVERLWTTHLSFNNFYNEPPFAERLLELSHLGEIPETAHEQYVHTVVACFIGNGYGVCHAAESTYSTLIQEFSPREIIAFLQLPKYKNRVYDRISNSVECRIRYIQALKLIDQASLQPRAKADYDYLLKTLGGNFRNP
jgi:hypothetical protein